MKTKALVLLNMGAARSKDELKIQASIALKEGVNLILRSKRKIIFQVLLLI